MIAYEEAIAMKREADRLARLKQAEIGLFAPLDAEPPHNGTTTSAIAARAIAPEVARLELAVLRGIAALGGDATRDQLERELKMPGNTVRPRVATLISRGLVARTEQTRPTPSGRAAEVVTLTPTGWKAAA